MFVNSLRGEKMKHHNKHHENNNDDLLKDIDEKLDEKSNPFAENSENGDTVNIEQEQPNAELQKKYDELNQQYLRLAADFDNYRKRQAQERESLLKYGSENALKAMIEVLDNFERGEKALVNVEDCQTVKDSFNLVHKQVIETLKKLGLEEIETEGKEFDPNFHEAVMQTPSEEIDENIIINELQKGYKLGDKVLRASLVNVATKG